MAGGILTGWTVSISNECAGGKVTWCAEGFMVMDSMGDIEGRAWDVKIMYSKSMKTVHQAAFEALGKSKSRGEDVGEAQVDRIACDCMHPWLHLYIYHDYKWLHAPLSHRCQNAYCSNEMATHGIPITWSPGATELFADDCEIDIEQRHPPRLTQRS